MAEYFGRGVFNSYKVIGDALSLQKMAPKKAAARKVEELTSYGAETEGKIRQNENARTRSGAVPVSVSEGRVRVQENK